MRQVPWESWQQWHHTRRCLFSSDSALVAKALDRITAWQCRGRVPVAVEITGELISIHQRDPQFTAGLPETAAILPGEMLRMMYAMAIMRLVNGVVDQSQKRNTTSVALRAEAAELPRVLVDIRHEAAHNELPSLPLLQDGSKKALDWLSSHYWDVQQQALHDAQTLLRLKLVQHSEMVHKGLQQPPPTPEQLPLDSEGREKGEKQSRKQLKKKSKEALRSAKQRQRAVFRELLELAQFAVGDVVALLVDGGLLVHDPCQTATTISSASAADFLEADVNNGDDGIVNNPMELSLPPLSGNMGTEIQRSPTKDDERTAAWKQTISQLSSHIPQLPILLLVEIVERLAGSSSRYNNIMGGSGSPQKLAKTSRVVLDSAGPRERFLEWATWILNEVIPFSDDCRSSGLSGRSAARIGSRHKIRRSVGLSKELLRELVGICLCSSNMDKFLLKLIPLLAEYFGDSSYARCLARLAGLGGEGLLKEDTLSKGGVYSVEPSDTSERDGRQSLGLGNVSNNTNSLLDNMTTTRLSPELAVKEAKQQQQAILNSRSVVAREGLEEEHVQSIAGKRRSQNNAGQHCKIVASWRPCAVGMLPSSVDCMGIIPKFSVNDIEDDHDVLSTIEVTKGKKLGVGEEDEDHQQAAATTVKDSETASTQTTDQQQEEEETTVSSCKKRKELESLHADEEQEGPPENDVPAKRRQQVEEMNKNCPIDTNHPPATNGEDEDEKYPRWQGIFLLQRESLEPHIVEELQAAICLL
ncbi:unnamed protein product [Sphagnum jensenii]|uniref:Las1-like protein n=1 Tax=Sphagnum jensenii TaxID=128206 RepID=A0ABP0W166_9BRYO